MPNKDKKTTLTIIVELLYYTIFVYTILYNIFYYMLHRIGTSTKQNHTQVVTFIYIDGRNSYLIGTEQKF